MRWIGYSHIRDRDNKRKYLDMLKSNFIEGKDFGMTSANDIMGRVVNDADVNTIIIRAKSFKKSLMIIRTEKELKVFDNQYQWMRDMFLVSYFHLRLRDVDSD
jgi:hypothetical protein